MKIQSFSRQVCRFIGVVTVLSVSSLSFSFPGHAKPQTTVINQKVDEVEAQVIQWRHHFHEFPELSNREFKTAAYIEQYLRSLGLQVQTGIAKTGVVGLLDTGKPGPVVALRADMDALPIDEATGLSYASKVNGAMHACGHDGHTAMLLGAAKYLAETRNFDGTAVVIFQPAEEGGGGGREMCEDGLMERFGIQEVYGMHNWPDLEIGKFAIRPGPFFAASDFFEITINGLGGHAAKPQIAVDPTLVGSHIVIALQSIVSRNADPTDQIVVSVTSFETSSTAFNVIPQTVVLKGTVRTLSDETRDLAEKRLEEIARKTGDVFGANVDPVYTRGYPVMTNSVDQTEFAASVAKSVSGYCEEAPLVMGGEDFSYMAIERPGAYILIGNGDSAPVHNPNYNFNDEAISIGCSWWAEIIEKRMPVS